jgi:hypothetical protein
MATPTPMPTLGSSRPSLLSFIGSLFTDGGEAFGVMDNWARVSDTSSYVKDFIDGFNDINKAGEFDAIGRPLKRLVNDLDLEADWVWFKKIMADLFISIVLAFIVVIVLILVL